MAAVSSPIPVSTEETLAFFKTIPQCAEILSQPNLRIIHPRNRDNFFHSTVRSNDGILKSVYVYQPGHTGPDAPEPSDGAGAVAAKPRGYFLLHLGRGVAGQPDIAHGGFLATVLDQVTGILIKASGSDGGRGAVTAYLNVGYRRPVRVPAVVVARAEVGRVDGRKIHVEGGIYKADGDGKGEGEGVCVTAEGMFLMKRDVGI